MYFILCGSLHIHDDSIYKYGPTLTQPSPMAYAHSDPYEDSHDAWCQSYSIMKKSPMMYTRICNERGGVIVLSRRRGQHKSPNPEPESQCFPPWLLFLNSKYEDCFTHNNSPSLYSIQWVLFPKRSKTQSWVPERVPALSRASSKATWSSPRHRRESHLILEQSKPIRMNGSE